MHTIKSNGDTVEVLFYINKDDCNAVAAFPNNKDGFNQAKNLASVLNGAPDITSHIGNVASFFSWAKMVLDKKLKEEENGR